MSSLPSGSYIIGSTQDKFQYLGRGVEIQMDLSPKPVVGLPSGTQAPKWTLEQLANGRYILKIGGAPTGVKDESVFAFLDGETPEEWVITHKPDMDVYTIGRVSDGHVWALPGNEEPENRVIIRSPILARDPSGPIIPNERWYIKPIPADYE